MKAELVNRAYGRQQFVVREKSREYLATYDVRDEWWLVTSRGRRGALRTFGDTYNRVVAACLPLIERAE